MAESRRRASLRRWWGKTLAGASPVARTIGLLGNLVAHLIRVQGRASSNLARPTNLAKEALAWYYSFVTYQYREKPLGEILLSAAGSMTAVALILFMRDLLISGNRHPIYEA